MERQALPPARELANPALWSVDAPNLYSAIVTVEADGKARDAERVSFGVRTAVFDADKGFFLNGKSLKIQGTCNHQDHAGVGAALPDRLQWFRLGVLREMGCNAVRTSHNMPTPEWVEGLRPHGHDDDVRDAADEFEPRGPGATGGDGQALSQLAVDHSVVHRQRGVAVAGRRWPKQGAKIAATMVRRCHELDPTRVVSAAVNGDNEKGVSDAFDIIGFNYDLESPRRISQGAIPSGPSTDRRRPAPSPRAACTRPIRCATR